MGGRCPPPSSLPAGRAAVAASWEARFPQGCVPPQHSSPTGSPTQCRLCTLSTFPRGLNRKMRVRPQHGARSRRSVLRRRVSDGQMARRPSPACRQRGQCALPAFRPHEGGQVIRQSGGVRLDPRGRMALPRLWPPRFSGRVPAGAALQIRFRRFHRASTSRAVQPVAGGDAWKERTAAARRCDESPSHRAGGWSPVGCRRGPLVSQRSQACS